MRTPYRTLTRFEQPNSINSTTTSSSRRTISLYHRLVAKLALNQVGASAAFQLHPSMVVKMKIMSRPVQVPLKMLLLVTIN